MDINKFITESKTFKGIIFDGDYNKTGKNLLDSYSSVLYLTWKDPQLLLSIEEYNNLSECISSIRSLRLENFQYKINEANIHLKDILKEYKIRPENLSNEPRITANKYIRKKYVIDFVFLKYGKKMPMLWPR